MIKAVIYFTSGLSMESVFSKEAVEKTLKLLHSPSKQGKVITLNEPNKSKIITICLESILAIVTEEMPETVNND